MTELAMKWESLRIATWVYVAIVGWYVFLIAGSVIVVLSENRNPIKSLAWVIALIFLPGIGLLFYLFFGRSPRNYHILNKRSRRQLLNRRGRREPEDDRRLLPERRVLARLAGTLVEAPLTFNNEMEVFVDGSSKFEALKRDLRAARESIYLQYYIFSDDELGREIADILIFKAKAGVDVRVIYDHVGSFSARNKFFRRMSEQGVNVHPFFRVTFPQLANRINWRNHRKIVVIDREVGYIGGMNIAQRYIKGSKETPVWRDTHFRLRGDIVESLLFSFAMDWNFMKEDLDFRESAKGVSHVAPNDVGMQLVTTGPSDPWHNLSLCFLNAIATARSRIYIQTPYFLPTDALQKALEAAAIAGLDVRVMIPGKSDSKMLQYASYSYVTRCLKAGISVYLYTPGMIHSKVMTIDDDFVTAGSTNFDFRSFENNFEGNLLIYDKEINRQMREIFFDDLKHCSRITPGQWAKRPLAQRMAESVVRLVAPIL